MSKVLKQYKTRKIKIPTGYATGGNTGISPGEVWKYHEAVVLFNTTLLKPLPDGVHVVPSTLDKDAAEFEAWEDRFLLCRAAMAGIRDCVFLEIVIVKGNQETWEYGT